MATGGQPDGIEARGSPDPLPAGRDYIALAGNVKGDQASRTRVATSAMSATRPRRWMQIERQFEIDYCSHPRGIAGLSIPHVVGICTPLGLLRGFDSDGTRPVQ